MLRTICLALVIWPAAFCFGAETGEDAIFVTEPAQKGIFYKATGKIIRLTSNELIMETGGRQLLYEREAVRSVALGPSHSKDEQALVKSWGRGEFDIVFDIIVKALQNTPIIGPYLSFLDRLSGTARILLAVLVLLGLIVYAAYRAYQMLVVATTLQNLNMTKLSMEVRKLRYDLEGIEKALGLIPAPSSERKVPPKAAGTGVPFNIEVPQIHIGDFVKHKIFRSLTEEEKKRRTELWSRKWEALGGRPKWIRQAVYCWRLALNWMATLLAALLSISFLIDTTLPFVEPAEFSGGAVMSLIFFVLFVVSAAFFLRLNAQRRIIRATYRDIHAETAARSAGA